MKKHFTFYLPQELRVKIEQVAEERKCTLTQVIKDAIIEYLERRVK